MKVIQVHAKRFEMNNKEYRNALVAFVAVEPGDEGSVEEAAKDLARNAERLGTETIIVYPYSRLSPHKEIGRRAKAIIEELAKRIEEQGKNVVTGPFGRAPFTLEAEEHPLAHAFKTYPPKAKRFNVIKEFVISPLGEFGEGSDCHDGELAELQKVMRGEREVEHNELVLSLCRRFGAVQNPSSPPGYHSLMPLAHFMFLAFTVHVSSIAQSLDLPVVSLKTPELVNYGCDISCTDGFLRNDEFVEHKAVVEKYGNFQDLPFVLFEVVNLFRNEKEVIPCYRSKYFTLPRIRAFVEDPFEAFSVALILHEAIHNEAEKLGLRYTVAYTVSSKLFDEVKDLILKLVRRDNRCAYLRIVEHKDLFLDVELHLTNSKRSPIELGSWKLRKTKIWGKEIYSISAAIMGSFERFLYVIFDRAVRDMEAGKSPELPAWLSPIQVRVIPQVRESLPYALSIAEELKARGVRVDVDDRSVPLSKKLRDAGKEWIPFLVLIGKREEQLGRLIVIRRKTNEREDLRIEDLIERIRIEVGSYPQLPQTLPVLYSKRPTFARPYEDLGQ